MLALGGAKFVKGLTLDLGSKLLKFSKRSVYDQEQNHCLINKAFSISSCSIIKFKVRLVTNDGNTCNNPKRSPQCRRFLWARECFCSRKHQKTQKRGENGGRVKRSGS